MQDNLKKNIKLGALIGGTVGLAYTAIPGVMTIASPETVNNLELILKETAFMAIGGGICAVGGAICGVGWHYLDEFKDYVQRKLNKYVSNSQNS